MIPTYTPSQIAAAAAKKEREVRMGLRKPDPVRRPASPRRVLPSGSVLDPLFYRRIDITLSDVPRRTLSFVVPGTPVQDDRPSIAEIITLVAESCGLTALQILSAERLREIVAARTRAIQLVAQVYPEMSLSAIGHAFGRNRGTIRHALDKQGGRQ